MAELKKKDKQGEKVPPRARGRGTEGGGALTDVRVNTGKTWGDTIARRNGPHQASCHGKRVETKEGKVVRVWTEMIAITRVVKKEK